MSTSYLLQLLLLYIIIQFLLLLYNIFYITKFNENLYTQVKHVKLKNSERKSNFKRQTPFKILDLKKKMNQTKTNYNLFL